MISRASADRVQGTLKDQGLLTTWQGLVLASDITACVDVSAYASSYRVPCLK